MHGSCYKHAEDFAIYRKDFSEHGDPCNANGGVDACLLRQANLEAILHWFETSFNNLKAYY